MNKLCHFYLACVLLWSVPLFAQSDAGELRLKVIDPSGLGVKSSVELASKANQFRQALATDEGVNLARGRVRPSLSVDASVGADVWKKDNVAIRVQADVKNLNNRINLTNFAGLFSGTALAPPRSNAARLETVL
jgi:outer membrane receptor for Fe3+-dicitrate